MRRVIKFLVVLIIHRNKFLPLWIIITITNYITRSDRLYIIIALNVQYFDSLSVWYERDSRKSSNKVL